MTLLTPKERLAVWLLSGLFLLGCVIEIAVRKNPEVLATVSFIDQSGSYPKIDLNSATAKELEDIPYIGEYTARKIVFARLQKGRFESVEELKEVSGVRLENYEKFCRYLEIRD